MPPKNSTLAPVHDIEAERCLIGSVIFNPHLMDRLAGEISMNDFHDQDLANLFDVMIDIHNAGGSVADVPYVVRTAKNSGLKFIGNLTRVVGKCADAVGTSANVWHYAAEVKRLSRYRHMQHLACKIAEMSSNMSADPDDIRLMAENQLNSIHRASDHRTYSFAELCPQILADARQVGHVDSSQEMFGTGFPSIDERYGLMRTGELVAVAARTSIGKSKFVEQIAVHNAIKGRNVLVISLEMYAKDWATRAVCSDSRVNSQVLRSDVPIDQQDLADIEHATVELSKIPLHVTECTRRPKYSRLRSIVKLHRANHGLDMLIVDYAQLIPADDPRMPRNETVMATIRNLKQLALELQVPVIVAAQLNREAAKERPRIHHIAEATQVEQEADWVYLLHRPWFGASQKEREANGQSRDREDAEVILGKVRNGPTGSVPFWFKPLIGYVEPELDNPFDEWNEGGAV